MCVCVNMDPVLVWMDNVGNMFMYATITLLGHVVCLLCVMGVLWCIYDVYAYVCINRSNCNDCLAHFTLFLLWTALYKEVMFVPKAVHVYLQSVHTCT